MGSPSMLLEMTTTSPFDIVRLDDEVMINQNLDILKKLRRSVAWTILHWK